MNLIRGGVYLADLGLSTHKPVLIVSDDGINMGLQEPIVARITENHRHRTTQTAVELDAGTAGLDTTSYVLCHDLSTLTAADFVTYFGKLDEVAMFDVERKLKIALRLD